MIKKMLSTTFYPKLMHGWLLVLRLFVAGAMMTHGYGKLLKLMEGDVQWADPIGLGPTFSLFLVVFSEFFCSIFIALGLFTRFALIPLIITMLVAAFIVHGPDPFGDKEMSLMYLAIYVTIFITGSGYYSMDRRSLGFAREPSDYWGC